MSSLAAVCHAVSCAVILGPDDAPRRFCPVHWCCVPAHLRSYLRGAAFDPVSVAGRLTLARARLAIAELEERDGAVTWLSGVVCALERIAGPKTKSPRETSTLLQ